MMPFQNTQGQGSDSLASEPILPKGGSSASHSDANVFVQQLLDSIVDPFVILDKAMFVRFANREAVRYFGEIVGKQPDAFTSGIFDTESKQRFHPREWPPYQALREGVIVRERVFWERMQGEPLPFEVIATPIRREGVVEEVVVMMHAIAPQMALERELREFISITSHLLRTPMSTIAWFLEILLSGRVGQLSPQQEEMAVKAREAALQLIDSVRLILDASQIELGSIAISPEPRDIGQLIRDEVERVRPFAEEKQQHIEVHMPRTLPTIPIDEIAFRIILANILGNAAKYTLEKGKIDVNVFNEMERIRIAVADTGIGIPEADQRRVFTKFFRAENALMTSSGTGLGLYVVKLLVDRVGGQIWFESPPGKGTTFTVSFSREGFRPHDGRAQLEIPSRPLA